MENKKGIAERNKQQCVWVKMKKKERAQDARRALFGQLRLQRDALGISQMELCKSVGMQQAQFSRIETGQAGVTLGTLLDISGALKLDLIFAPKDVQPMLEKVVKAHVMAARDVRARDRIELLERALR